MNRAIWWALPLFIGCAPKAPAPTHTLRAEHALVGTIWQTSTQRAVSTRQLLSALAEPEVVLLGEKHDNADHHVLQGWVIEQLRPSAVAFEMLDDGDDLSAKDSVALAEAVNWSDSGWPDFSLYEPVFDATIAAGATVLSAHPTRAQLMGAMRGGELSEEDQEGLPLHVTLDDTARAELTQLIVDAHCGHANDKVVHMMIDAQQLKDAWMARALQRVPGTAVLVAGGGHTVRSRGVPLYLDRTAATLTFVEVQEGSDEPADYDVDADFLWFTPRVDEQDPCERFKEQLQKMKHP